MKTSKYIQTALLLFIFATTLVLFLDAKSYTEKQINRVKGYYDSKLLTDFSVIVAQENSKFWLRKDSINSVYYQCRDTDGALEADFVFECFTVKNDTLFISHVDEKYTLYVNTQSVNKIIGKENSEIGLSGYYCDTLSLTLTKAKVRGSLRNDSIKLFKIEADNHSDINLGRISMKVTDSVTKEVKFKPLDLKLNEADVVLKDHSELKMPKPQRLIVDADETSYYTVYGNSNNNIQVIKTVIKKSN